ncbi:alpha/beta hydrolase family protein, partial [Rhizobiaceae sp. 2RAB30]
MPKTILSLVVAAAAAFFMSASSGQAAEKTIDFQVEGQKVVGTLALPDGVSNPPVILLLHGFTGSRNELVIPSVKEGIFQRAARMWADKGIASLRIDFRGNGESEGKFEDMTLDGQVKDALAALDFLANGNEVDDDRMAVVGWSMGGAVAATVAGRTDYDLRAVALWAPGTNMPAAVTLLLGADTVKKALANRDTPTPIKLPWGAEVSLKGAFFESLYAIDPVAEIG